MNRTIALVTSILMTFAGLLFLSEVKGRLNGAHEYKKLAKFWKDKVAREQLKKLIAVGRFADFKQDVALLIPEEIKLKKVEAEKKQLRNLASVIPHEGTHEITLGRSAGKMLEEGKALVVKRDYEKGIQALQKMITKFPDSHHVVEAHYLIVEAHHHLAQKAEVIVWVDKMVELFPENRLTGYALLKVGDVYENDGRPDDAIRIYKTIVAVYSDKRLISQAQVAVSELEL